MAKRGGFGGGNMGNMMRQMQKIQKQMEEAQAKVDATELETSAGGGAVKVRIDRTARLRCGRLARAQLFVQSCAKARGGPPTARTPKSRGWDAGEGAPRLRSRAVDVSLSA